MSGAIAGRGGWNILTPAGQISKPTPLSLPGRPPSRRSASHLDAPLARELDGITTAPVVVLALGYDAATIRPLDGFGFLVPRGEGIRTLGALWETSIYPNRAPAGKALLRIILGGSSDRAAVDAERRGVARHRQSRSRDDDGDHDARPSSFASPAITAASRSTERGHLSRLERIDGLVAAHSGLHLAGNSYRGVSMNSCIAEADRIAEAVLAGLASRPLALAG